MILSFWIFKLVFLWTISHIACNAVEKLNIFGYNDAELVINNIDPETHMEITDTKRFTRSSEFEKGYEEFLRNYHHDNDIGPNHDQGGHYRVVESDENASYGNEANEEADDGGDDDDDESDDDEESGSESGEAAEINEGYADYDSGSGSESVESNEKRKSYKAKPQSKTQTGKHSKKSEGKNKHKKIEKKTKPKKKKCKKERRDNMLCTICYNPISDEKSESCSYSSEPKEHNYAYTEDSSFGGNKDKEPESLEGSESDESDNQSEGQTIKPERKNPPSNKYPVYNSHRPKQALKQSPSPRPHTNRNKGPQTFDVPQTFRITRKPSSRYQTKKSSPNVTLLRYRTVENPFTNERIRLILPAAPNHPKNHPQNHPKNHPQNHPQNHPKTQQLQNNRLPDVRPPRDVNNAAQTESILSNVTKEHDFEYLPSHLDDEASRHSVTFTNKDGLKCKKSIDGNKVCFECFVDGERRKECIFSKTHKPTHFFESYTTSKKSKHSLGSLNPLEFNLTPEPQAKPKPKPKPKPKHTHSQYKNKPKSHSAKTNKNKKHVKLEEPSSISPISEELEVFANVEKLPAETEAEWSLNPKNKPKQPETDIEWSSNQNNKHKQPETDIEWSSNQNNKHKQLEPEVVWNVNLNNKPKPIKSQPLREPIPEVIYGKSQPLREPIPEVTYGKPQQESESYTIFYEPKPIQFIADTSSRTIHTN